MSPEQVTPGELASPAPDPDASQRTARLLASCLGGDQEAARTFFERFRRELLARARRHPLLRSVECSLSAEDVLQEVWWRALSSGALERFEDRGHGAVGALLGTILERTLADLERRRHAQKRGGGERILSLDAPRGELAARGVLDSAPTPTGDARALELLERCREVLDEREWRVWNLREVEGLEPGEIAVRLGTSGASVRGLLFRARAKLIRALGEQADGGSRPRA